MPTRTLIFLCATIGLFVLMVIGIIITILVTGKKFAKKHDDELDEKFNKKNKEEANQ